MYVDVTGVALCVYVDVTGVAQFVYIMGVVMCKLM